MGSIAADADRRPHAVCVPFPAQGHVTPMLKLAKILHSRGFHITFVNTEFNHRRLLRSRGAGALDGLPDFRFAAIPEGLPPSDADATQDVPSLCRATMENCLPHFRSLLAELNSSPDVPPVTCVVGDDVMSSGPALGQGERGTRSRPVTPRGPLAASRYVFCIRILYS